MSSLLLFVNIQSLLMARRWNRLWDNSLQFNRKKKAAIMQKCKYEYLHIVWTICALMASIMTLVFRRLWNDIRTILICWCTFVEPVKYDMTTEIYKFGLTGLPVWEPTISEKNLAPIKLCKSSLQLIPLEPSRDHKHLQTKPLQS